MPFRLHRYVYSWILTDSAHHLIHLVRWVDNPWILYNEESQLSSIIYISESQLCVFQCSLHDIEKTYFAYNTESWLPVSFTTRSRDSPVSFLAQSYNSPKTWCCRSTFFKLFSTSFYVLILKIHVLMVSHMTVTLRLMSNSHRSSRVINAHLPIDQADGSYCAERRKFLKMAAIIQ